MKKCKNFQKNKLEFIKILTNMILKETSINNLKIIEHDPIKDQRGFFCRLFCQDTLSHILNGKLIKQINRTFTKNEGIVRGLHFQHPPHAETKIISCVKGKVWDVAVDLRKKSSTFMHFHAEILTEDSHKSYLIPEGFAHGFQTLTSDCEMLYFHTANYNKESEDTINAIDPMIGIKWPLKIKEQSERDKNQNMLTNDFNGIEL